MGDNDEVIAELFTDKTKDKRIKKMILLGSEGSGKSTIMRQIQTLYGAYFDRPFIPYIHSQIIEDMLECIELNQNELSEDAISAAQQLKNLKSNKINSSIANLIEILWKED